VLDNLTTTIVMVSLMRKLLARHEDRLFFAGIIVIAANAGGAWTPIGDVTTTMLWIGGQISSLATMRDLLPGLWSPCWCRWPSPRACCAGNAWRRRRTSTSTTACAPPRWSAT
jgi:hypothetical protein